MSPGSGLKTGFDALDRLLPSGGWPRSGLTEIVYTATGIGLLRLLLPALASLSRAGGWLIWVAPPCLPYPPILREHGVDLTRMLIVELPEEASSRTEQALWACEQALRFAGCAAALLWLERGTYRQLRRLQVAAESGATWGIVFRPERFAEQASPAPCRVKIEPRQSVSESTTTANVLQVTLLKARGGQHGAQCRFEI